MTRTEAGTPSSQAIPYLMVVFSFSMVQEASLQSVTKAEQPLCRALLPSDLRQFLANFESGTAATTPR